MSIFNNILLSLESLKDNLEEIGTRSNSNLLDNKNSRTKESNSNYIYISDNSERDTSELKNNNSNKIKYITEINLIQKEQESKIQKLRIIIKELEDKLNSRIMTENNYAKLKLEFEELSKKHLLCNNNRRNKEDFDKLLLDNKLLLNQINENKVKFEYIIEKNNYLRKENFSLLTKFEEFVNYFNSSNIKQYDINNLKIVTIFNRKYQNNTTNNKLKVEENNKTLNNNNNKLSETLKNKKNKEFYDKINELKELIVSQKHNYNEDSNSNLEVINKELRHIKDNNVNILERISSINTDKINVSVDSILKLLQNIPKNFTNIEELLTKTEQNNKITTINNNLQSENKYLKDKIKQLEDKLDLENKMQQEFTQLKNQITIFKTIKPEVPAPNKTEKELHLTNENNITINRKKIDNSLINKEETIVKNESSLKNNKLFQLLKSKISEKTSGRSISIQYNLNNNNLITEDSDDNGKNRNRKILKVFKNQMLNKHKLMSLQSFNKSEIKEKILLKGNTVMLNN